MCDKIEIIDGKYYPISIKGSNPPIKGVWDQDAIELVAHAILLEEEFETEVFVGFVDYEKIMSEFLNKDNITSYMLTSLIEKIEIDNDKNVTIYYKFSPLNVLS